MEAYLAVMKANGRKLCLLSVKTGNLRQGAIMNVMDSSSTE